MEIKVFQKCYRFRKGFGNVPQRITVTKVDGENITFVWGHIDEKDFEYTAGLMGGACKTDKIITEITKEQRKAIQREDKKIKRILEKHRQSLEEFRARERKEY